MEESQGWQLPRLGRPSGEESINLKLLAEDGFESDSPQCSAWRTPPAPRGVISGMSERIQWRAQRKELQFWPGSLMSAFERG